MEFNQVSVSFCFRIDGTFFLRKQGQHLRENEKVFQDSWHGKILLCATVEADHDQEEDEEEECEAGEGVDYRGGGRVGHHPVLLLDFPPLEGSFRRSWLVLLPSLPGHEGGRGCWFGLCEATAIWPQRLPPLPSSHPPSSSSAEEPESECLTSLTPGHVTTLEPHLPSA